MGAEGRVMTAQGTALLIIDMQRDFCDPRGYAGQAGMDVEALRRPIPAIARLLDCARACRWRVIYTREGHRPGLEDCHAAKLSRSRRAGAEIGTPGPLGRLLIRGEYGHDIIDELTPQPEDIVIDKPGYGAFYQTDLDIVLRARQISRLVITGVTTDVCVHSTLREATDRGYECITVSDACAASEQQVHEAALRVICHEGNIFGEVIDTETLMVRCRTECPT
jgi:nicotinamidase-related amidase